MGEVSPKVQKQPEIERDRQPSTSLSQQLPNDKAEVTISESLQRKHAEREENMRREAALEFFQKENAELKGKIAELQHQIEELQDQYGGLYKLYQQNLAQPQPAQQHFVQAH